jgi:hypothetical protein
MRLGMLFPIRGLAFSRFAFSKSELFFLVSPSINFFLVDFLFFVDFFFVVFSVGCGVDFLLFVGI